MFSINKFSHLKRLRVANSVNQIYKLRCIKGFCTKPKENNDYNYDKTELDLKVNDPGKDSSAIDHTPVKETYVYRVYQYEVEVPKDPLIQNVQKKSIKESEQEVKWKKTPNRPPPQFGHSEMMRVFVFGFILFTGISSRSWRNILYR